MKPVLLLCIACILVSCSKSQQGRAPSPETSSSGFGAVPGKAVAGAARPVAPAAAGGTTSRQGAAIVIPAPATVTSSRPVQLNDHLLSLRGVSGAVVAPRDYDLGVLQNPLGSGDSQAIERRIDAFVHALGTGKVPVEAVAPDWRENAVRSFSYALAKGVRPLSVRVALVSIDDPRHAHAGVKIYGDPGRVVGTIYLENQDGKWLVSDLQADLMDLTKVPQAREQPYQPDYYDFLNPQ